MKTTVCDICGKYPTHISPLYVKQFSVVDKGMFGREIETHKFDICSECLERIMKEVRSNNND